MTFLDSTCSFFHGFLSWGKNVSQSSHMKILSYHNYVDCDMKKKNQKICKRLSVQYIDHCLKKNFTVILYGHFGILGKIKMHN